MPSQRLSKVDTGWLVAITSMPHAVCVALLVSATPASAAFYELAPLDLGSGYSLSGAIFTDGTMGPLSAANVTNWSLKVTAINDIVYTPSNTHYAGSQAFVSGGQLLVPTSPDGSSDGGSVAFRAGNYFQVQAADFTGANVGGGRAFYVAGPAFDFLPLHRPNGINEVVANESAPGSLRYSLVTRRFSPTKTMTGTLSVASANGPALFADWNILIRETLSWTFNPGNSSVLSDLGLAAKGNNLTVTPFDVDLNPGAFMIGGFAGGDLNGVILGDFS